MSLLLCLLSLVLSFAEEREVLPQEIALRKLGVERCAIDLKITEREQQVAKKDRVIVLMREGRWCGSTQEFLISVCRIKHAEHRVSQAQAEQKFAILAYELAVQRLHRQSEASIWNTSGQDKTATSPQLEPQERTQAFQVTGKITAVLVKPGDVVKTGQVLARLDDSLAVKEVELRKQDAEQQNLAVQVAEIDQQVAKGVFERSDELYKKKALSKTERDEDELRLTRARIEADRAKLALAIAKTALQKAELELRRHTLASDFNGVVTAVHKHHNESNAAHQAFLTVRVAGK